MVQSNQTTVTEFILLGFPLLNNKELLPFIIILIVYILTISTNIIVIIIVSTEPSLHKPMYIFISAFSFLEICYTSVTVPTLLWVLINNQQSISYECCIVQFYFHFSLGATECFSLFIMAYDRYVAICNPLRYVVIMSPKICIILLLGSWLGGFIVVIVLCLLISDLQFCGPNEIDHYYCDFASLLKLSCSESSHIETLFFAASCFVILGCFMLIILSYAHIIRTTMNLPKSGRRKTFSTCASHMFVVLLFYGTLIFMFVRTKTGQLLQLNKIMAIFPSVVTPLLNPIIYTLRNKEVKAAVKKIMQRTKGYHLEGRCFVFLSEH
ncbi:olfactory receptor 6F1-like [Discoglossus pictus]